MKKPTRITITESISDSAHTDLCYLSAEWNMTISEVIEILAKQQADDEENKQSRKGNSNGR